MRVCACLCDNVTTCDNVFFVRCHAISICFCDTCDNVTTKITPAPIQAHTHALAPIYTYIMSHCHNVLIINKLKRDNVKNEVVTGWHCDNEVGLGRVGMSALLIRLGHLVMSLYRIIRENTAQDCWGFVKQGMRRLRCASLMLIVLALDSEEKVLPKQVRYGAMTRRLSLVSKSFFGVSFRFFYYKNNKLELKRVNYDA